MKRIILAVTLTLAVLGFALGQTATKSTKHGRGKKAAAKMADHGLFKPDDIKWGDAPNALPPGAKLAVLEGNPMKLGIYTMRLWMPDGYKISPHYHTQFEHVTVISGQLNLGMGDKFDESKGNAMPAGTFGFLAPHMKHFAWATGETVIQLHGIGPWEIVYVNPKDDPRKMKK
jgi:hypothetical protein